MAELKGGFYATIIFLGIMLPAILMITIDSIHQHAFMKHTTELSHIVKQEGGVSPRVSSLVTKMEDKGYDIDFVDLQGNPVTGIINYGETVQIVFDYEYDGVRTKKKMHTVNEVFSMKR